MAYRQKECTRENQNPIKLRIERWIGVQSKGSEERKTVSEKQAERIREWRIERILPILQLLYKSYRKQYSQSSLEWTSQRIQFRITIQSVSVTNRIISNRVDKEKSVSEKMSQAIQERKRIPGTMHERKIYKGVKKRSPRIKEKQNESRRERSKSNYKSCQ